MAKKKVFLLDDEQDMLDTISEVLEGDFEVTAQSNCLEAIEFLKKNKFDAIILDINMPLMNGFDCYKQISDKVDLSNTAVMFLSGVRDVQTKVDGLNLGADDYILKPILSRELIARVKNRIKRLSDPSPLVLRHGATRLNLDKQIVEINGSIIDLTPTEYKIFMLLWKNNKTIVPKDKIISEIWPSKKVAHHTIDTHLFNLRKKLIDPSLEIRVVKSCGIVLNLLV